MTVLTYRTVIHRAWMDGRTPDPETYWGDISETTELIDSVLCATESRLAVYPVAMIEIMPIEHMTLDF